MGQTARRTMIADVARAAGVSKSTVSFAFNAPERLSPVTAARVREIANAMNYRPDPVARMLARRRTMTIGVLTPQGLDEVFTNPYFASLAAGVATAAESSGYTVQFISPLRGSLARAVDEASVDGILAVGLWQNHPEIGLIRRAGIPFVVVDSTALQSEPSVRVDDEGGSRAAAEHLVGLGHRRFGVLAFTDPDFDESPEAGPGDGQRSDLPADISAQRFRGYRRVLERAGIRLIREAVASSASTFDGGADGLRRLVRTGIRPTAVLAMSDALAIGAMQAARALQLRVPDDLSVVGFDDIELAQYVDPPLTTVHQSGRQKGDLALRMLVDHIERRPTSATQQVVLETRLIIRGSTGPAPHDSAGHDSAGGDTERLNSRSATARRQSSQPRRSTGRQTTSDDGAIGAPAVDDRVGGGQK